MSATNGAGSKSIAVSTVHSTPAVNPSVVLIDAKWSVILPFACWSIDAIVERIVCDAGFQITTSPTRSSSGRLFAASAFAVMNALYALRAFGAIL